MRTLISFFCFIIIVTSSNLIAATQDSQVTMVLRTVHIEKEFTTVTQAFEAEMGVFNPAEILPLLQAGTAIEDIKTAIDKQLGGKKIAIFSKLPMGQLYTSLKGTQKNVMKYFVGNPFPAMELLGKNNSAATFVPLVVNIHGDNTGTVIEYLVPSSVLQHISTDSDANGIGQMLDSELDRIIEILKSN